MPANSPAQPLFDVRLVQCPALAPEQRLAAESRFRAALESALGGTEQVLLALQAYQLAKALAQDLDGDLSLEPEPGEEDEDEADAESLITLWEKAESDAITAAIKPLSGQEREQIAEARFEIIPH